MLDLPHYWLGYSLETETPAGYRIFDFIKNLDFHQLFGISNKL